MRTIKFRVWDKNEKRFIEWFNPDPMIHCASGDVLCYERRTGSDTLTNERWINKQIEVQQFTGFKDKNGNEIYEGDILKIPDSEVKGSIREPYSHVWYSELSGSFMLSFNHLYSEVACDLYKLNMVSEIIGNIFENPDLLP